MPEPYVTPTPTPKTPPPTVKLAKTRVHVDTFSPQLVEPVTPVTLTGEQLMYLTRLLEVTSSDRQFAAKALKTIVYILNPPAGAVLTSLTPSSAALGSPSFTLHVVGTGFDSASKIYFNGGEETTTFVSATELTTGVDMSTAGAAVEVPVVVEGGNGAASNELKFTFTPAAGVLSTQKSPEVKTFTEPVKK